MSDYSAYVGLDIHKDAIAVAVALPGRKEPTYRGEIKNERKSLLRLVASLSPDGEVVSFCYEAGSCGYGVYREIIETGQPCIVVAPSLIPRRPGERVKTDRRDALMLARLHRAGELKARQRLAAFLLRHDRIYRLGSSRWTQKYFRWLEEQRFADPVQQVVFQEYVDTVTAARYRVAALEEQMREALSRWSLRPVVEALGPFGG